MLDLVLDGLIDYAHSELMAYAGMILTLEVAWFDASVLGVWEILGVKEK